MHEITMIGRTEVLDQAQIVGLNLSIHVVCILWYITYQITWKLFGSNIPYQLVMNPDWTQEKKPKTFKTHYYSTTFQAIDNVIIQNKNTIKHYNTCTGISRVHLMLSSVKCI